MNIYDFTITVWRFLLKAYKSFNKLWNTNFNLIVVSFSFQDLMTVSLIVAITWILIKKFI